MSSILALDVGEKRVGVARASLIAKLPEPLTTLDYDEALEGIKQITEQEEVSRIVVGLPFNLNNEPTMQTSFTEDFIVRLRQAFPEVTIDTFNEALSSVRAKSELGQKGKQYEKKDVDALAATHILDDYLQENQL